MTDSDKSNSQDPTRSAKFPANFASLEAVRGFVGDAAEACGLGSQSVYAVQLAVDEAFTNIIEHAYGGESQKEKIECTCKIGNESLTVVIRDCGRPFDPTEVPDPNLKASLEDREEGGLGLFFMRQLMDEVTFSFNHELDNHTRCNILTMVKHKGRRNEKKA